VLEAGLPPDIGVGSGDSITIESILQEKKEFDTSLNFEKLGLDDGAQGWSEDSPSAPTILASLPSRSNILSVSIMTLALSNKEAQKYAAVTTADRHLHLLSLASSALEVAHSYTNFQDSPILDVLSIDTQRILVASMSGKLSLYDTVKDEVVEERKDHNKYIVKLASSTDGETKWIASAGWDAKVFLYKYGTHGGVLKLGEPAAELTLPSIPEALAFVASPHDGTPVLLIARRDSTFLHFYTMPSGDSPSLELLGRQNLAPHSNAWIAFTPSDVQICPTDASIVAVATSTTPHMKLLILKLLVPSKQYSLLGTIAVGDSDGTVTQASQARAELLVQDREEAAILINVSTLAPQTQYSTPRLAWRPDGSGVYVSSDDGVVRGIEATTGKLMVTLEGHDPGSKLRCLWAGNLETLHESSESQCTEQEYLISGGFDTKLILWHP
jgi:WD40 repeat protein